MQLNVSGHHVDMSDSLKNYVHTKFGKLERHFDSMTNVNVVLTVEKQSKKAEASVNVTGGQLFAIAESEDMYAAIDSLADKLNRQILKHKEKLSDHHRAAGGLKTIVSE